MKYFKKSIIGILILAFVLGLSGNISVNALSEDQVVASRSEIFLKCNGNKVKLSSIISNFPKSKYIDKVKVSNKKIVKVKKNGTVYPKKECGAATIKFTLTKEGKQKYNKKKIKVFVYVLPELTGDSVDTTTCYRDTVVIPDRYNTGVEPGVTLIPAATRFSGWDNYITSDRISQNGGYVFENIEFTGGITIKSAQIDHALYFKNCTFTGGSAYAVIQSGEWTANSEMHFDHCEFTGFTSAVLRPLSRTTVKNCKIHHMSSDGGKGGFSNGGFENCYFYDLGYNNPAAHADGIQTTGYNKDFYIRNCRFDVPSTSENVGNAGIFFIQEYDSADAELKDILINGGNYSFYLGIKDGKTATITGLTGSNIKIGSSYQYGRTNIGDPQYQNWTTNGTITPQDKLFVSSVFMGDNGAIKVIASNYTRTARLLILVSDVETKIYTVPAHPTNAQASQLTFEDLPYDLEYEIEGNYVVCYDTSISSDNKIRFANVTGVKLP